MKKERSETNPGSDLRQKAEERLKESNSRPGNLAAEDSRDALALVHELQVHQIELEMQNEELKRTKLEAEDALAKYSDLYDFAPIGLFTLDAQGLIQEVNLAGAALLGVERRNLSNRSLLHFVSHKDRVAFDDFYKKAFETSVKQTCELSFLRNRGPAVYVRIEGTAAEEGSLNKKQCRIAAIDITKRKQAEEELQEARNYSENLINFASAPIVVWDPSFKITRFNNAFERLAGVRASETLGKPLNILFPENSRDESLEHIRRTLSGERWEAVEIPILKTDGSIRTVLWNSANIYSGNGSTVVATIAQGQDITDRKLAEQRLEWARDELELKVQDRTSELKETNETLLVAIEAAEAAAKAKSDFMANMSHEIRTPMNAVIGMTSLLLDDETLTPEHRDFIETIRMSGDALMVIINDILDFSKMDHEKTFLENQPFNLRNCIEESIDLTINLAEEKMLNLSYRIDENVPQAILGDPDRLRQILVNLLNNAIKFTNEGEVKLSVSYEVLSNIHEIHFAIQDPGIGISPDDIEKLFKPFSQVETSVTRNYGGTGLGLAISKKLVELMGGRIWVESELGKGSTFHFTIRTTAAPYDAKPFLKIIQPRLVGKNVLIINADKTNRHILSLQSYSWGMVPLTASNGREALSWIQRGDNFDLVILDGDTADVDRLELAREMRKINGTLPIVLLAPLGHHETSDIFTAILTKPIEPAQLYAILLELFAKKPSEGSSQANGNKGEALAHSTRILLAEDNAASQKVIEAMLKRLGYRADAVANGIEALQALDRQHYDIVLMDVKMPEMDGLIATKIIRQRWPENGPKIIAVTAFALQGDRERCIEAGMDDYISKPIKMEELAEVLRKYQQIEEGFR